MHHSPFTQRRFDFFEKEVVKDADSKEQPHRQLRALDLKCCSSGAGRLVFGDTSGYIYLSDSDFALKRFKAHHGCILLLNHLREKDVLISIGEGLSGKSSRKSIDGATVAPEASAVIRLWAMDAEHTADSRRLVDVATGEKEGPVPLCTRRFEVYPAAEAPTLPTCMDLTNDLKHLAVGLDDGTILLFLGTDLLRDRGLPRREVLRKADGQSVTNLGFCYREEEDGYQTLSLFASTTKSVFSFMLLKISPTGQRAALRLFNNLTPGEEGFPGSDGAEENCAVVTQSLTVGPAIARTEAHNAHFVVAQPDMVYTYGPEASVSCFCMHGAKQYVGWYKSYLVIVSRSPSGTGFTLSVFDVMQKLAALSMTLTEPVLSILPAWGHLYVMTQSGTLYQLTEKDLQTKLAMLYDRHEYDIAVDLAHNSDLSTESTMEIFGKQADHYFSKGAYEEAVKGYKNTIGHIPPSYVIRKFLDVRMIGCLTYYLEQLHVRGHALSAHTSLLLNCYIKLRREKSLRAFIRGEPLPVSDDQTLTEEDAEEGMGDLTEKAEEAATMEKPATGEAASVKFDTETVISCLRNAGYAEDALFLAEREKLWSSYILIQVEDLGAYAPALRLIQEQVSTLEAEDVTKKYGLTLMRHVPNEMTALLIRLCTPRQQEASEDEAVEEEEGAKEEKVTVVRRVCSSPSDFVHLFVNQSEHLRLFLTYVIQHAAADRTVPAVLWHTLIELCFREALGEFNSSEVESYLLGLGIELWSFYGSEREKEEEQTAVATDKDGEEEEEARGKEDGGERTASFRKRKKFILSFVQHKILQHQHANYDASVALLLVQRSGVDEDGSLALFLYSESGQHHMIIQHHIDRAKQCAKRDDLSRASAARRQLLVALRNNRDRDPNIWIEVLQFLTDTFKGTTEDVEALRDALSLIQERNLLPQLKIIQILASNRKVNLDVVRSLLLQRLSQEAELVAESQSAIGRYKEDISRLKQQLWSLRSKAVTFNVRNCASCDRELYLPARHFICKHSYHEHCLDEGKTECPICAAEQHRWLSMRSDAEKRASDPEKFFSDMRQEEDGFSTIASAVGNAVMSFGTIK